MDDMVNSPDGTPWYQVAFKEAEKRGEMEEKLRKAEALQESAYIAGLKAGWNFGIKEDHEGMARSIAARDGYLKPLTRQA